MAKGLKKLFLGTSAPSAASSALNLVSTVVVVRWFGADTYANYIVDLALLSLGMILLEVVPSNYSVFRIQDDPSWKDSVAAQLVLSVLLAAIAVFIVGGQTQLFRDYSAWMALYAATLAAKRYLDLRLQASGRLPAFMNIELLNSAVRVVLLALCFVVGFESNHAVWGSLAVAAAISQGVWWLRNPQELRVVTAFLDRNAWVALYKSFPSYVPYYSGIVLKRLKDNLVPLVAEMLFASRELLASFLLAYRGVIFAVGQIRILEALMNHRATLAHAAAMSTRQKALVALAAQALCIAASAVLLVTSGLNALPWGPALALSFMVWPVVYLVLERSRAYSNFQANRVNGSILMYLVSVVALSALLKLLGVVSPTTLAWILVVSELFAFLLISNKNKASDVQPS